MEGEKFIERKTKLGKEFHSNMIFTDKFTEYLNRSIAEEKEHRFFSYLEYTAPHWQLQAPREVTDKYGTLKSRHSPNVTMVH